VLRLRTKRMPRGRQFLCATKSRPRGYGELRGIPTASGFIVEISVAYGNQLAGVVGVELSLGEIAHFANTICGRREDRRVKLAGVTWVAWCLLPGRKCRHAPRREPHAHCYSPKTTMFMKSHTVTGRTVGKSCGRQKFKLLKKSKLFVAGRLQTLFYRNRSRSGYVYENKGSYE